MQEIINGENLKSRYSVRSIDKRQAKEWVKKKHYAKRIPSMQYVFGIFDSNNLLVGVCVFSPAPSRYWNNGGSLLNYKHNIPVMELSRLVLNDGHEDNLTSFFVSKCLRMLPRPSVIVSFADSNENHCGYIYQATNFIYTGLTEVGSQSGDWILYGKRYHGKSKKLAKLKEVLGDKYDPKLSLAQNFINNGGIIIKQLPKHRYIYINYKGKGRDLLLQDMIYQPQPYPRTENIRYDSSYNPIIQLELFSAN